MKLMWVTKYEAQLNEVMIINKDSRKIVQVCLFLVRTKISNVICITYIQGNTVQ